MPDQFRRLGAAFAPLEELGGYGTAVAAFLHLLLAWVEREERPRKKRATTRSRCGVNRERCGVDKGREERKAEG